MNVLFLSRSASGHPHAFVKEQADALQTGFGINIRHLLIEKGGFSGTLKAIGKLKEYTSNNLVDIIHVHYGLWTMVAVITKFLFLKKYKIVVTYHGSDIYKSSERPVSLFFSKFASWNILVSGRMLKYFHKKFAIIPCGIDTEIKYVYRKEYRDENKWTENDFVVLFSSSFKRKVKDPSFAFDVIDQLKKTCKKHVIFIELAGFSRFELTRLMQAADAMLMCSVSEGSPQVIKEAILNRLPVVSNDIGDVRSICGHTDNTFIIEKTVNAFVDTLDAISASGKRIQTNGPVLETFDNRVIAQRIFGIYCHLLNYNQRFVPRVLPPMSFEANQW